MRYQRILCAGVVGIASNVLLSFLTSLSDFSAILPLIISALLAGYIARKGGFLSGAMVGIVDAIYSLAVFMIMGNVWGGQNVIPLPPALVFSIISSIPVGALAGIVGSWIYTTIIRIRSR